MSLLLLFTGSEAPPAGDPQQHLLLALQWTPSVEPPPEPSSVQHLLLALQWTPGDIQPEPEPEQPIQQPQQPIVGGASITYEWDGLSEPDWLQRKPNDDEVILAVVMAFIQCEGG